MRLPSFVFLLHIHPFLKQQWFSMDTQFNTQNFFMKSNRLLTLTSHMHVPARLPACMCFCNQRFLEWGYARNMFTQTLL